MESGYDPVLKICKLCNTSIATKKNYKQQHYLCFHDEDNQFVCDYVGCSVRCRTGQSLRKHKNERHDEPEWDANLPEGQRMVWAEEIKMTHNNSHVGVFVGVAKCYHVYTAARQRENNGARCIVNKHFLSEGLCYCDHETARKLFTVTVKRRENEGQAEFEKRVLEVTAAYKMYSRQHFQNCIYSNYGSTHELSEEKKEAIRNNLQNSAFSNYYSENIQQALTYHNWKNSQDGQEAVAAKREREGITPQKRMATSTVTSDDGPQPKKKRDTEGNEAQAILIKMINEYGRSTVREMCDKLSQEEKKSNDLSRSALGDLKINTGHENMM